MALISRPVLSKKRMTSQTSTFCYRTGQLISNCVTRHAIGGQPGSRALFLQYFIVLGAHTDTGTI